MYPELPPFNSPPRFRDVLLRVVKMRGRLGVYDDGEPLEVREISTLRDNIECSTF